MFQKYLEASEYNPLLTRIYMCGRYGHTAFALPHHSTSPAPPYAPTPLLHHPSLHAHAPPHHPTTLHSRITASRPRTTITLRPRTARSHPSAPAPPTPTPAPPLDTTIRLASIVNGLPMSLWVAYTQRHMDTLVHLLADPDANYVACEDNYGRSLLWHACTHGDIDAVRVLLSAQADINCVDFDGTSPLHAACMRQDATLLQLLLTYKDLRTDIRNGCGQTALHVCAAQQWLEGLKLLLPHVSREDVDMADLNYNTPLLLACGCNFDYSRLTDNYPPTPASLKPTPATLPCTSTPPSTSPSTPPSTPAHAPAHLYPSPANTASVNLLLKHGATWSYPDISALGQPLDEAARYGQYNDVAVLLAHGIDSNMRGPLARNALHLAIDPKCKRRCTPAKYREDKCSNNNDYEKVVELLLQQPGVDALLSDTGQCFVLVRDRDNGNYAEEVIHMSDNDMSVLIRALKMRQWNMFKRLLQAGANVNELHRDGSVLMRALYQDTWPYVGQAWSHVGQAIIACPQLDVCIENPYGYEPEATTFMSMVRCGNVDVVKEYLATLSPTERQRVVNHRSSSGRTPLWSLLYPRYGERGNADMLGVLIEHGADVSQSHDGERSFFTEMCQHSPYKSIDRILATGFCNFQPEDVLVLAQRERPDVLAQVLKHVKNVEYCDDDGASPLVWACHYLLEDNVDMLLAAGADFEKHDILFAISNAYMYNNTNKYSRLTRRFLNMGARTLSSRVVMKASIHDIRLAMELLLAGCPCDNAQEYFDDDDYYVDGDSVTTTLTKVAAYPHYRFEPLTLLQQASQHLRSRNIHKSTNLVGVLPQELIEYLNVPVTHTISEDYRRCILEATASWQPYIR